MSSPFVRLYEKISTSVAPNGWFGMPSPNVRGGGDVEAWLARKPSTARMYIAKVTAKV